MTDPQRPWRIDREPTDSPETDSLSSSSSGSGNETIVEARNILRNFRNVRKDKDLEKAVEEAVRRTEENHKKETAELKEKHKKIADGLVKKNEELQEEMAEKEASHRRLQVMKVLEIEAVCKRKLDETEAGHKKKLKRLETDLKKKRESEATYKRKIQETLQCVVCSSIGREGHILQCQNGHVFCESCADNLNRDACPTCRVPFDQLTGNKRIRALAIEQLIEAVKWEFICKHPDCTVTTTRSGLIAHEKKCELRKVPCPDAGCTQHIPFQSLLDHIEKRSEVANITSASGILVHEFEIPAKVYSEKNFQVRPCTVAKFEDRTFLIALVKLDGIYYTYLYIHGDQEEANMFMVTITIGGGTQSGILHYGQIFPIDTKKKDIVKASSGVLSFSSIGMGSTFFQDQNGPDNGKKISIQYKISKVPKAADQAGFDVSSRVEVSSNGLQVTEWMAN